MVNAFPRAALGDDVRELQSRSGEEEQFHVRGSCVFESLRNEG